MSCCVVLPNARNVPSGRSIALMLWVQTVARRTARARAAAGPLLGKLLRASRGPRPTVDSDPRTETRAAAANIVGVLWATASQGATVKELSSAADPSQAFFIPPITWRMLSTRSRVAGRLGSGLLEWDLAAGA
jgi:hypothetical protein